jgi:hypothetical protein
LKLRARSVSEVSELSYKCNNKVIDDEGNERTCGNIVEIPVNLLEVEPESDSSHTNKIELTDKLGIVMRYPNVKMMKEIDGDSEFDNLMNVIVKCVDYIYDENSVYHQKDVTHDELVEFMESLNKAQFEKVQNFFDTIPKMKKTLKFHCGKCGYDEEIVVEGLQSFFV